MKAKIFDEKFDREAQRRGVSRQAIIKTWLVERLDQEERRTR